MEDASMEEPDHVASSASISGTSVVPSSASSLNQRRSAKERRMRLEKVGLYRIGRTLGHGNFAQVKVGYHEIANTKVAVKIVDTQTLDPENLTKIDREIRILQKLNHPYIIKLYEVIRSDRYWYIITEYVGGGELFDLLTEKGKQSEPNARKLFQQITSAVAGCHGKGVVHRDIKAENLLLDKENNIKLIDFGFSNIQKPGAFLTTWCGSPPYAAPELLLGQEYDGSKSDVWSLGVILYILVTAGFPFPGDSVEKLKCAVLNDHLKIPFWVSVECADLIRKMLTVAPAKRYSLQQVTQHRWFVRDLPEALKNLIKTSLKPEDVKAANFTSSTLTVDRRLSSKPLDPTVMIFMQQHSNWTEEQIVEEVLKQNYESPIYATYELLNNKLAEFKDNNSASQIDGDDHPRRGSRGSIISGKANVEPETSQTTIPAHHLAKLSLSASQDYDSDDSSASDMTVNEESSSSPRYRGGPAYSRRRLRRNFYQDIPEQQPSEQRRHTLCAADRLPANPLLPAQPIALDSVALANAAAMAMANYARLQQLQRHRQLVQQQTINNIGANVPFVNIPVSQERRASANEALLGLNSYAHLLAACSTIGMTATDRSVNPPPLPGQAPRPSVEEEGQSYLNHYGSSKRNTIHDFPKNVLKLSIQDSLTGLPTTSLSSRHSRTPYAKQNGNERRSSWASSTTSATAHHLSPQQQAQLEKLYMQATSRDSKLTGVQQLQKEFEKLKACTQEQQSCSSEPSNFIQNRSLSMIPNPLLEMKAPTISITDENNRCTQPYSGSFDPLSFLAKNNQPTPPQSMGTQQRPATVIGFTSTSSTASTPDSQPAMPTSMVKFYFIPLSLDVAIERLPKCAASVNNLIYELAPDTDLSQGSARVRFSQNNILFDMILHRMDHSPNISKTEFQLISGDSIEYENIRTKLVAIFNEIC